MTLYSEKMRLDPPMPGDVVSHACTCHARRMSREVNASSLLPRRFRFRFLLHVSSRDNISSRADPPARVRELAANYRKAMPHLRFARIGNLIIDRSYVTLGRMTIITNRIRERLMGRFRNCATL